jgi:hypothetical protein
MIIASKEGKFKLLCVFDHNWKEVKVKDGLHYWQCGRCGRKEIIGGSVLNNSFKIDIDNLLFELEHGFGVSK